MHCPTLSFLPSLPLQGVTSRLVVWWFNWWIWHHSPEVFLYVGTYLVLIIVAAGGVWKSLNTNICRRYASGC